MHMHITQMCMSFFPAVWKLKTRTGALCSWQCSRVNTLPDKLLSLVA